MRPKILPIFHNKQVLGGFADLGNAGQHTVREDVSGRPGIAFYLGIVAAYSLEEKDAVIFKAAGNAAHKGFVVFLPDVLEHADGHNLVENAADVAVIAIQNADRQTLAEFTGVTVLFP